MIRFGKSVLGRAVRRGEQIMLPATSYVKPRNVQAPVIDGSGTVGAAQTYTPGLWLDAATYNHFWALDGVEVQTGGMYTPVEADRGKTLTLIERTTSNSGLQAAARSAGVVIP